MYIFLTNALPYINGILHIGHIYEFYILNFYYNLINNYYKCYMLSGIDCNGLIKKFNINKIYLINEKKIKYFNLNIFFSKTISFINKRICNWNYVLFCDKNYIIGKINYKFYNKKKKFFIPDKYLEFYCFKCLKNLENFYCLQCNFFKKIYIKTKIQKKFLILKKINSIYLLNYKFYNWDISRYNIYNGIKIISKKKNYFYVWYDAIISYISNNLKIIKKNFFKNELFQIIGKDIVYFHKIFKILLYINNYKKNTLFIHSFIYFKKKKISKSKKNFLNKKINIKKIKIYFLFNIEKNKNLFIKNFYNLYKNIFIKKIINLFFRIRKIFDFFNNILCENIILKKNHEINFYFLKKKNINKILKKIFFFFFKLNKKINKNFFWKKKCFYIKHYFYTNNFFYFLKEINFFLKIINEKYIKFFSYNNFIFNLKKNEIN
ncbi:methionyl-tRNA synthetase [Candidatus Carsonella ruddii CS isolate Thao2000]|uniref:Methionyl-tRNA synthetase n=1 Tax=Candidatus Carsonella ruddii CS isolate Thao2000 TaxID=1202537 RepID=J7GYU5_CARRU|nr:class I tRNA ligase family protein [Candidatus Carsonella ruddii]AFP83778.1 methionyl-tRNA synthetase [Candidatus Carsonella ruddii CS isolate Thao2000]